MAQLPVPAATADTPLDVDSAAAVDDDEVYACRRCARVLEEGRAFELGGERWHIECFRCSRCDRQLDCDANLLVLGNGDLLCATCCYACSVCGTKIADLAILTAPDTAFCANCFRCRNCKRPIENLRYARTRYGIFCIACHEKLLARRRKKTEANVDKAASPPAATVPPAALQKDLPPVPAVVAAAVHESSPETTPVPDLVDDAASTIAPSTVSSSSTTPDVPLDPPLASAPEPTPSPTPILRVPSILPVERTYSSTTSIDFLDSYRDSYSDNELAKAASVDTSSESAIPVDKSTVPYLDSEIASVRVVESDPTESSGGRRPSISSMSSFSVSSFTQQSSRGFLSDLSTRRASTSSFISSKVRSISRAISVETSNAGISSAPTSEAHTPLALQTDFLFPPRKPTAAAPPIITSRQSSMDSITVTPVQAYAPDSQFPRESQTMQPSVSAGLPPATIASGQTKKSGHRAKRSISTGSFFHGSFSRTASVSSPQLDPPNSAHSTRSFFAQFSSSRKDSHGSIEGTSGLPTASYKRTPVLGSATNNGVTKPATPPRRSGSRTPRSLFGFDKKPSQLSPHLETNQPESRGTDLRGHETAQEEQHEEHIETTPALSDTSAFTLPELHGNGEFSLEADFADFLREQEQREQQRRSIQQQQQQRHSSAVTHSPSTTASPKSPGKDRFHALLRMASKSTLLSLATGNSNSSSPQQLRSESPRAPPLPHTMLEHSSDPAAHITVPVEVEAAVPKKPSVPLTIGGLLPAPSLAEGHSIERADRSDEEAVRKVSMDSSSDINVAVIDTPATPTQAGAMRKRPAAIPTDLKFTDSDALITPMQTEVMRKRPAAIPTNLEFSDNMDDLTTPTQASMSMAKSRDELATARRELHKSIQRIIELKALDDEQDSTDASILDHAVPAVPPLPRELPEVPTSTVTKQQKRELESEIEKLFEQRSMLFDENVELVRLKDRLSMETANLSTKVKQLSDLSEQLTRQIQQKMKTHKVSPAMSGSSFSGSVVDMSLPPQSAGEGSETGSTHGKIGGVGGANTNGKGKLTGYFAKKITGPITGPTTSLHSLSSYTESATIVVGEDGRHEESAVIAAMAHPVFSQQASLIDSRPTSSNRSVTSSTSGTSATATTLGGYSNASSTAAAPSVSSSVGANAQGHGGKFWRRRAGQAAKGITKMFGTENGTGPGGAGNTTMTTTTTIGMGYERYHGPSDSISSVKSGSTVESRDESVASSEASFSGLNIVLPKSKLRPVKGRAGGSTSAATKRAVLFGVELCGRIQVEGRAIPLIVTRCVEEVEFRGMTFEGIYRKSGITSHTTMIQSVFESWDGDSSTVALSCSSTETSNETTTSEPQQRWEEELRTALQGDICGVTSVLKQYLRHLPTPLITYDAYTTFVSTADVTEDAARAVAVAAVIASLPAAHQTCLEYLAGHLSRVTMYAEQNLMNSRNLAVVFAPTLVRDEDGSREIVDAQRKTQAVQFLIENVERVFAVGGRGTAQEAI
ncbi:uncharacterized protein V1518DRAFT_419184 [Limtongia smithiae]|uniref:uncharacterized protein n=1 Tax=Limtongia smithiae TaxID=1125753 RepID=UPI0034CD1157